MKKIKNNKIIIIVLLVIFIGIISSIATWYIYSNSDKNFKVFDLSMKDEISLFPGYYNYHDAKNSYITDIKDIKFANKTFNLKYKRDYKRKKVTFYLNDEELLKEDLTDDVLTNLNIMEDYLFVATGLNDKYRTLVIGSDGKIKKTFDGSFKYINGSVLVVDASLKGDEIHTIESFKFDLKDDLKEYDQRKDEFNCDDFLTYSGSRYDLVEIFKEKYCYQYKYNDNR